MNAKEIKKRRKELNLTQSELAKMIGVSPFTVLNYEKGKKIPDSKIGILNKVLFGKEESIPEKTPEITTLDEFTRKIIKEEVVIILKPIIKKLDKLDIDFRSFLAEEFNMLYNKAVNIENDLYKRKGKLVKLPNTEKGTKE